MPDAVTFTAACPRCGLDCDWTGGRHEYVGEHGSADRTMPRDTCPCWAIPGQRTPE